MFSLIITVVAIALVAVLALATLYYGGSAFGKGAARAEASKIVLQGQQLVGAADLYYTANRAWPTSMEDLVQGNYLKQVPVAQGTGLEEAVAAGNVWTMPLAGVPMFVVSTAGAVDVCAEVNLAASLRKRGILRRPNMNLVAQCYGDSESALKTVFKKAPETQLDDPDPVSDPPPTQDTDPEWWVPPGDDTAPDFEGGITLSPTPLAFGSHPVFATSPAQTVTLTNGTDTQIQVDVFQAGSGAYVLSAGASGQDCLNLPARILEAGASCTARVQFSPLAAGPANTTLQVSGYRLDTWSQFAASSALTGTGVESSTPLATQLYMAGGHWYHRAITGNLAALQLGAAPPELTNVVVSVNGDMVNATNTYTYYNNDTLMSGSLWAHSNRYGFGVADDVLYEITTVQAEGGKNWGFDQYPPPVVNRPYRSAVTLPAYLPFNDNLAVTDAAWCISWTKAPAGDPVNIYIGTATPGFCMEIDDFALYQSEAGWPQIQNVGTTTLTALSAVVSGTSVVSFAGSDCIGITPGQLCTLNLNTTLPDSTEDVTVNGQMMLRVTGSGGGFEDFDFPFTFFKAGLPASECPGGTKVHLHGGYEPNRLGIDQWVLEEPGMYHGSWHESWAYECSYP